MFKPLQTRTVQIGRRAGRTAGGGPPVVPRAVPATGAWTPDSPARPGLAVNS
jgi:hypothetical protein